MMMTTVSTKSLRIAVADDEPSRQQYFREVIPILGYQVASVAGTGCELIEQCRAQPPDLIITDIKMPEMDGIDAAIAISKDFEIPVILVSAYHDDDLVRRAEEDHVFAYLVKPIKQEDLEIAIRLAVRRFEEFRQVRNEAIELRDSLAHRKVIERAKGLLMKTMSLDEEAAFMRLQKLARDRNKKLIEIAEIIVDVHEPNPPR